MGLAIELIPRPLRFTSRKKNVKVTMKLEVSKRAYIIRCHGPTSFLMGICNRGSLATNIRGAWHRNTNMIFFIQFLPQVVAKLFHSHERRRDDEEGEKVQHEENSLNCPFQTHMNRLKISTFTFWCMVASLGRRSVHTLSS